jgi:hypothetical protein
MLALSSILFLTVFQLDKWRICEKTIYDFLDVPIATYDSAS